LRAPERQHLPGATASESSLADDLQLITDAARRAGEITMEYFGKDPEVWLKEGDSPVSEADHAADKYLHETLIAARPDYGWLSEETTDNSDRLERKRLFIVDPIDGTRGFIKGMKNWCVSIAVVEGGRPFCGVLECPALNETYVASLGEGAWLNGKRLVAGKPATPPRISGPKPLLEKFGELSGYNIESLPFVPSLAYRMAMVASGQLEGTFARANSHDWDIAAADLILHEAEATLSTASGEKIKYNQPRITHNILIAAAATISSTMGAAAQLVLKGQK